MDIQLGPRKALFKKIALYTAIALVAFAIIGFLALPPIVKSVLVKQLHEQLHRDVAVSDVDINPFALSARVEGLSVKDRDGKSDFLSFDALEVNVSSTSIFRLAVVLDEAFIKGPRIRVVRNPDLTYNFTDLLEEFSKPSKPSGPPAKFSLNNIRITGGSIDFDDQPKRVQHSVRDLTLSIPFVSNIPYYADIYVKPGFSAKVNGTPVELSGRSKPFSKSLETTLDLNVRDIDIPKYMEYLPMKVNFSVPSGKIDARAELSFVQREKTQEVTASGGVSLKQFALVDGQGRPVLNLPFFDVPVQSANIFAKRVNFGKILLRQPEIFVSRDAAGKINLLSLLPDGGAPSEKESAGKEKAEKEKAAKGTPFVAEAAEMRIADGVVHFQDDAPKPMPFKADINAINCALVNFSTAPSKKTGTEASFTTDGGEAFKHAGSLVMEPLAAEGTLELVGLGLKRYAPYYRKQLLFDVADGAVDFSTRYRFEKPAQEEAKVSLSGLAVTLHSLRLRQNGNEFLKLPVVAVKDTDIDLNAKTVTVGEVSSSRGSLLVKRDREGGLNLAKLVVPSEEKKPAKPEAPWMLTLRNLSLDGYSVKLEDHSTADPATLLADRINISASGISNRKAAKGRVSVRAALNKNGKIAAKGSVGLTPVAANLDLDVKGVEIMPFQPYFTDKIKIIVTSGAVSTQGKVSVQTMPDKTMNTGFAGSMNITGLATADKANAESFLNWNSLYLGGIKVATQPMSVEVDEIALADFYSRLIINADGTLNVQQIFEKGPETATAAQQQPGEKPEAKADEEKSPKEKAPDEKAPKEERLVKIHKVTLQGGNINFSDHFVKPNFSANLTEIGGMVSDLSSLEDSRAEVMLRGTLDNYAPLEIAGTINPFGKDLFVDLKANIKGIELNPLSTYSGKYAGYGIEKGKLSLDLKYHIEGRKLQAENHLFLDQFTFGEKVESPDATKLPVRLAIALLKNRKGEIDINLPISGSLDDPEFSVGGLIVKVIVNLLVKAATSPFALLGSLLGGGEELSYLEFDYGRSTLDAAADGKLTTLAKALADRPSLKLEIAGQVDPVKDREGLKHVFFDRKVKAQKLKTLVKKGTAVGSIDEITVSAEEYPDYLAKAYKEEKFPKPRNILGFAKGLPVPEIEKLMLANIAVTDDDLRQLAADRAQKVKERILKSGQVEQDRVFLVAPEPGAGKKEKARESRVDFVLK